MDSTSAARDATPEPDPGGRRLDALRRDPACRAILRRWRSLTGDLPTRRTLAACSGGADSSALVAALASRGADSLVVAHVLHDMRSREEASGDRDFVRELASSLGVEFVEASVRVPSRGNAEAGARRLRYAELARLARERGCSCVATGHHAQDQLETMLLALLRGAGPGALAGMRERRTLEGETRLIRPMLRVTRADSERLCALAGIVWREDRTNLDTTRARGAIRHEVLPLLERIRPGAASRAGNASDLLRGVSELLDAQVRDAFGDCAEWERDRLRGLPSVVVGEGLRRAFAAASGGGKNDRLARRVVDQAVVFIRSRSGERREFQWPAGVRVEVAAARVRVTSPC